jgi:Glycosyl hydrolase family 26
MKALIKIIFLSIFTILFSCQNKGNKAETKRAKFEPEDGKVLIFAGQELEAIGGTDVYRDGYFDYFPKPAGFTGYTDFLRNNNSFGFIHKGLDGLTSTVDWGDGPENISILLADNDFENSCLALGLDISQGNDSLVALGKHDDLIIRLGQFLNKLGNRPVFLRVGYEFDGFDWNHYKPAHYVPAFRRVKNKLDSMGVNNVAYVWQSKGAGANRKTFDEFYPGDEFVDWVAYSYFSPAEANHPMLQFAKDHQKPLFIAEATPVFPDDKFVGKPLDLTKQADAEFAWKEWFLPFFKTITDNKEVKAFSYINAHWKSRPMWKENSYFKNIDSRITKNDWIKKKWLDETNKNKYLKASQTLFQNINQNK